MISVLWSLLTYFWSMQPLLTCMKAGAFALVVLALVSAGYRWVQSNGLRPALSFMIPLYGGGITAGVLGRTEEIAYDPSRGMELYRGLTGNSNMFGSLMFMISPLLIWQFHVSRRRTRVRLMCGSMVVLAISMLALRRCPLQHSGNAVLGRRVRPCPADGPPNQYRVFRRAGNCDHSADVAWYARSPGSQVCPQERAQSRVPA